MFTVSLGGIQTAQLTQAKASGSWKTLKDQLRTRNLEVDLRPSEDGLGIEVLLRHKDPVQEILDSQVAYADGAFAMFLGLSENVSRPAPLVEIQKPYRIVSKEGILDGSMRIHVRPFHTGKSWHLEINVFTKEGSQNCRILCDLVCGRNMIPHLVTSGASPFSIQTPTGWSEELWSEMALELAQVLGFRPRLSGEVYDPTPKDVSDIGISLEVIPAKPKE